ncbi:carbohydrate ABC transporter permease [Thermotoga profunda]|uniref:carbohydrate ABC transporter permease n=1 Tax=Thermotoga profunda TaxID=1508420 RepID=UPI000597E261|nr:carbohydrate ABC transporter permease [Thermotoga profunda]
MRKFIFSTFIYLLVACGAMLMLLPFAWMVSTSFKARSEVEKWPPQWGSKNFSRSWDVKVKVSRSSAGGVDWRGLTLREALTLRDSQQMANVLSLQIDDDPVYRGTITINLPKEFSYLRGKLDQESFNEFIEQLNYVAQNKQVIDLAKSSQNAEEFFSNFFVLYHHGQSALLDRRNYVAEVEKTMSNSLSQLEIFERYANRIPENERENYLLLVSNAKKSINNALSDASVFKKGTIALLQRSEIENLREIIKNCIKQILPESLSEEIKNTPVMQLYVNRIVQPLQNLVNVLDTYDFVNQFFKSVQTQKTDTHEIVFKFLSKAERDKIMLNQLAQMDFPERIRRTIDSEISRSTESLPEKVDKALDEQLYEDFKTLNVDNLRTYVQQLKQPLSVLSNALTYISSLSQFQSLDLLVQKLKESGVMEQTVQISLEKLESLLQIAGDADLFWQLLVQLYENIQAVSKLRIIYNQSQSSMKIVQAPEFVKNIRLNRNQNIEIELNNTHPVYLEDENYSVRADYSPKEVFANIFQNYAMAWKSAPFGIYYINTAFVSIVTTILEIIFAAMAAYAFAIMRFPGKNLIFALFLGTMMIPGEVLLVPNFITISKLGWIDTYYALIIPWIVSVFAIFLMRQHFLTLPSELKDAALIDGCSHFRYLWTIVAPLSKPTIITSALLKFVGSWNAFLWVLIVTNKDKFRTLPVGLQTFSTDVGTVYNQLMAAATFSILPIVILFLFTQKYFIRGVAHTGLK